MKIVVTGGAGFIGGNFVYYMLKKRPEDTIICLDKLTYAGNMENMAEAMKHDNFKFVRAGLSVIIRFLRMKSMGICRWTDWICSLRRQRICIPPARIRHPRLLRICW